MDREKFLRQEYLNAFNKGLGGNNAFNANVNCICNAGDSTTIQHDLDGVVDSLYLHQGGKGGKQTRGTAYK